MRKFVPISKAAMFALYLASASGIAQNAATLDQAKAGFTSKTAITTITLDGTFASVEGSLKQVGNAHAVVSSDGTYLLALSKNSGVTAEQRTRSDSDVGCTWKDARNNDHPMEWFNCQTPAWFLPELHLFLPSQTTPEWSLSGQYSDESGPHLKFNFVVPAGKKKTTPEPAPALDLELSSATMLPSKALFFVHPDGRASVDIPIEITYQDYRQVGGVNIPFRIQKFVNGTLVLDITVSTATVN